MPRPASALFFLSCIFPTGVPRFRRARYTVIPTVATAHYAVAEWRDRGTVSRNRLSRRSLTVSRHFACPPQEGTESAKRGFCAPYASSG
jgi:hypothetical protein